MTSSMTPTKTPGGTGDGDGTGAGTVGTTVPTVANGSNGSLTATAGPTTPMLAPGATVSAAGGATGTWQTNVIVDALFGVNEVRNAWIRVVNVGWKKIFNATDGAFTALITLASQAKQTGRPISYREEADGMVHEIYLW